jgi:hypothetical protein
MAWLASAVGKLGLRLGIYTAVSTRTCGGYIGSLGYEDIDAQTFLKWGMSFVKVWTVMIHVLISKYAELFSMTLAILIVR